MNVNPCRNLDGVRPLAEAFYHEAKAPGDFDFEWFKHIWGAMIEQGTAQIFCLQRAGQLAGIAGVLLAPGLYGNFTYCQEAFWYVDKEKRKRGAGRLLYTTIEKWAKENGAGFLVMIELHDLPVDYSKMGFERLEHSWIKEIT